MADIFISYASEDLARAKVLAEALVEHGWSVWWDRTLLAGKDFDEVIEQELDASRSVIVIWSATSVSSRWVKAEAREALSENKLVPVLLGEVRVPLVFRATQAQNLEGWSGDTADSRYRLLLDAIAELVSSPGKGAETEESRQHATRRKEEIHRARTSRRGYRTTEPPSLGGLGKEWQIATLEVVTGENRDRSLDLTEGMTSVTIGRSADCDLVLDSEYIRSHCRVVIQPNPQNSAQPVQYEFTLKDTGSTGGTLLNGERVDQKRLQHGDRFQIGDASIKLHVLSQEGKEPPPPAVEEVREAMKIAEAAHAARDVNSVINENGETRLMITARSGTLEEAVQLVKLGGDLSKVDRWGETVRQKAMRNSDERVLKFFESIL